MRSGGHAVVLACSAALLCSVALSVSIAPHSYSVTSPPTVPAAKPATGSGPLHHSRRTEPITPKSGAINTSIPGFSAPQGLAYDGLNTTLYITDAGTGDVDEASATTDTIVQKLHLTDQVTWVVFDPKDNKVFVGDDEQIDVVWAANDTLDTVVTPTLGQDTTGAVYVNSTDQVFVSDSLGNVTVLSGATNSVVTTIPLPVREGFPPIVYDPVNSTVFVVGADWGESGASYNITVVSTLEPHVVENISLGSSLYPEEMGFDPHTGGVYVLLNAADSSCHPSDGGSATNCVDVFDGQTYRLTRVIEVGTESGYYAGGLYDPADQDMYLAGATFPGHDGVAEGEQWWVFVLDQAAQVGEVEPEGLFAPSAPEEFVEQMAYDNQTGAIFAALSDNASVAIIPPGTPLNSSITQLSPRGTSWLEVGETANFNASTFCGATTCPVSGAYSWHVFNSSLGSLNSTTGSQVTFTAGPDGDNSTYVAANFSALGYFSYAYYAGLTVFDHIAVTIAPTDPATDVNATVAVNARAIGGLDDQYSYVYSESSSTAGCIFTGSPTVRCTPTAQGTFTVSVTVTNAHGEQASATTQEISVGPQLYANLVVSNSTPLLGQTVAFVASASGGVGAYTFNYTGLPLGCASLNRTAIGCLPTQANYYNVTVSVTDQNNVTVLSTVSMQVIFDFNVVVPTNTSAGSPFTISVNTNESFSGATSLDPAGGIGAFTYNYSGLPAGCASANAPSITCTPTETGTYHISISVHDQVGDHRTHTVVVHVVPAPASSSGLASLFAGTDGYVIAGSIGAVAALVIGVVVWRARRGRTKDATTSSNVEEGPSPP
jgi:hypothetical protein